MIKRFWPYWLVRFVVLAALIRYSFDWWSAAALAISVDVIGGVISSHIFRKAAQKQTDRSEA